MAIFTAIGTAAATAALGAAAAGTIGFTFIATATAAVLQIAAGIAVSLIAKSMAGEPQAARFSVQGTIQSGDDVPRSINFGWNSTAGSKVYQNEHGDGGVYSTRVIALGDMPVRELVGVEVYGVSVTLDATPHASYGRPVLEYRKGGKDHLWIKFYDGTQTVADPFLTGTVSSVERPYDSGRVGRGIPYVIATSLSPEREDGEEKPLFQGFPTFKFSTYGVRLYDISKDFSVGGSGTQRWANPSTWGGDGDFLPPVQIYNLLRGMRFNGQWVYGLQDVSAARLPSANWIAQINKARSAISGPDGLEPQYRAGGEVQVGAPIHLGIEALLTSCQGRLVENGGSYKIYVGEPDAPVMSFTDGDIISTEEQTFTPFFGLADTINGIAATYPNPAESWNSKTAPSLLRPDLEVKDGNRRLMASVSLDMVPYSGQVQRLMQSALLEALRARRHTFVLGPEFRVLEAGDIIQWSSDRNGYEDKLFRVDGIIYKSNLDNIVDITEVDPSDYDWDQSTDYRPVVDGPLTLVGPVAMPMSGWQVFPAEIHDNNGIPRRPSIEVWAASGLSNVDGVRVQVRLAGETLPFFDSPPMPYGTPWKWILQGSFPPNVDCEARGIFIGPPGAEWSSWLPVTTPNILLGGLDIYPIDLAQLDSDIAAWQFDIGNSVRDTREAVQRINLLVGNFSSRDRFDKQTLRKDLVAAIDGNTAKWSYEVNVLAAADAVAGSRIETIELTLPTLATLTITDILSGSISTTNGNVTALGVRVTSIESTLPGLATVSALSALTTTVTTQGGTIASQGGTLASQGTLISANATAITALEGVVGYDSGQATFKMAIGYTPSAGWTSSIGIQARSGSGAAWRTAGLYFEATASAARIVMDGDQVVIKAGGTVAALFESGTTYIANARVHNLTATNIDVANLFAQNAAIAGVLTVGSYITIDGPNGRIVYND